MISPRHAAAREYASQGIRTFPTQVDGKRPLPGTRGHLDATTDIAIIDAWWAQADYNVAIVPGSVGWFVVDVDPRKGGDVTWNALAREHGIGPTFVVKTPSGGHHFYFKGNLPPGTNVLGPGVDVRGRSSYVLAAPSYVIDTEKGYEGPYTEVAEVEVSSAPQWIMDLASERARAKATAEAGIELDQPGNVARAREFIKDEIGKGHLPAEGSRNTETYKIAATCGDLGCSEPMIASLLLELWNPHLDPPLDQDEIELIAYSGTKNRQNDIGCFATEPAVEVWPELAQLERIKPLNRFKFQTKSQWLNEPKPVWRVPGLLPDNATVLVVAPTQNFKSFLMLDLCLGIATGTETFGFKPEPAVVLYAALEGRNAIKHLRVPAWQFAKGVDDVVIENFIVGEAPKVGHDGQMAEFHACIEAMPVKPKVIVIDTLGKSMIGMDESSTKDAGTFIGFCDWLKDSFGCTVIAIHHPSKAGKAARGSSAFEAGFDTTIYVEASGNSLAVKLWVNGHKDADTPPPWYFQGHKMLQSLVFLPVSEDEYKAAAHLAGSFTAPLIEKGLKERNAVNAEAAITTMTLAIVLNPKPEAVDAVAHDRLLQRVCRALETASLGGYRDVVNGEMKWYLHARPF